jgi:pre-mRNA branch site protein p14
VDHLSGFNVCGRYLIVLYYQQSKMIQAADNNMKRKELDELKSKFGIKTEG